MIADELSAVGTTDLMDLSNVAPSLSGFGWRSLLFHSRLKPTVNMSSVPLGLLIRKFHFFFILDISSFILPLGKEKSNE